MSKKKDVPITENDPKAYREAAEKLTSDGDDEMWVVQVKYAENQDWRVSAILPTYEDAQQYINDHRTFTENCSEDMPEEFGRKTAYYRYGSRDSPTKVFETWPPGEE